MRPGRIAGTLALLVAAASFALAAAVLPSVEVAPFGPRAVERIARTDAFPHCPDILLNSRFWQDTEEVAAFEELVGSHGGMGGTQSHPEFAA